jgi:hypothetical protein
MFGQVGGEEGIEDDFAAHADDNIGRCLLGYGASAST